MIRVVILIVALIILVAGGFAAEERYAPDEPFAAIDGQPVFLGELNLILAGQLRAKDLERVNIQVQQATALLLVRRHLAMKSLREVGGNSLDVLISRRIEALEQDAQRRGTSLAELAQKKMSDDNSLKADIAWQIAWSRYTESRLSETNLRNYFNRHRDRYAGNRWEVSQIFVKLESTDSATVESTRGQLLRLAEQIKSSGDVEEMFAQAARDHSHSGSAADGGRVGWVEKDGDLPSSVMASVRKTKSGQIGDPVRSPLGMHLVYVHRHEQGELTFEQLTDQAQLRRDATDALFQTLIARQRGAKVQWFIRALRPPEGVAIIPER